MIDRGCSESEPNSETQASDDIGSSDASVETSTCIGQTTDDSDSNMLSSDSEDEAMNHSQSVDDEQGITGSDSYGLEDEFMEEKFIPQDMLNPVYLGANLSTAAAYCSIMTYAIHHKLSYSAIEDLLNLLQHFCPSPNYLPSNLYKLKKFFKHFS